MRDLTETVRDVAFKKDIVAVQLDMKRHALYDDYRDLYEKVVPPTVIAGDMCNQMSQEIETFKKIIEKFDENMT